MPLSGPSVLALHHVSHEPLGSDEIQNINAAKLTSGLLADARLSVNVLKFTGGYPGGNTRFLREDGTFVATSVSGGTPAPHHATHEQNGIDEIVNAAWINKTNFFNATQVITLPGNSPSGSALRILSNSGEGVLLELRDLTTLADRQTGYFRVRGGGFSAEIVDEIGRLRTSWSLGDGRLAIRMFDPYPTSLAFQRLNDVQSMPTLVSYPNTDALELRRYDNASRSVFLASGFGDTPLDASQLLSGALPDARLSINVLKYQGGYPGGTINFLRADGTFSEPPMNTGPMGPQGPAGASSTTFTYRSDTQSQAPNDPGTGKLKWNNVDQQAATEIYFDWITADSIDITNIIRTTSVDDTFIIQDADFAANYKVWKLLEPVTIMADWFLAKVQFIEAGGAGSFSNNQRITIIVKAKGETGPIGPQGPAGADGKSADLNYTGDYNSATVYKDGDIVVASDGVAYLCVVEGTNTPPEPWPGVSNGIIAAHANTHALGGSDVITLDTTQVTGLPATLNSHTSSINSINANAAFKNQANSFNQIQTISMANATLILNDTSGVADAKNWRFLVYLGDLYVQSRTDGEALIANPLQIKRSDSSIVVAGPITERSRTTPMGVWITYTPTLTPDAGTITSGSTQASYMLIGNTLFFKFAFSSWTLTGVSNVTVSLPFSTSSFTGVDGMPVSTHVNGVWGSCLSYKNGVGASFNLYGNPSFANSSDRYFTGQLMFILA
jgi:hypothetical protein